MNSHGTGMKLTGNCRADRDHNVTGTPEAERCVCQGGCIFALLAKWTFEAKGFAT